MTKVTSSHAGARATPKLFCVDAAVPFSDTVGAIPNAGGCKMCSSTIETDDPHVFLLDLQPKAFLCCWWLVCLVHVGDACFLFSITRLYSWLLNGQDNTRMMIDSISTSIPHDVLGYLKWLFTVTGGLHLVALARVVFRSWKARRLVFFERAHALCEAHYDDQPQQSAFVQTVGSRRCSRAIRKTFDLLTNQLLRPTFSIDGKYFDQGFLVQECIEVASQIFQAGQLSSLIATRWINHVVVAMIFLNCMSTPLIHWVVPKANVPLQRLLNVSLSSFLAMVNSVVIPLVVFMPYVRDYDPVSQYFRRELLWDDVWFVEAVRENEQLLLTSYSDLVTTLLPHLSLLGCLLVCAQMLQRVDRPTQPTTTVVVAFAAETHPPVTKAKSSYPRALVPPSKSSLVRRFEHLVHALLCLSGFVVVGIHIASQSVQELQGCKLHATPWFQPKSSCVVMNVNCYRRDIQGDYQEIDAILTQINSDTLFTLLFTHCPKLQIPTSIQSLHRFQQMEIYNSTIDQWPVNASLRQEDHDDPCILTISRTNMTEIPHGLLDPNGSLLLSQLILYESNVTTFPPLVSEVWWGMISLWVIKCPLTEVPPVFSLIELIVLDNAIESINFDLFESFCAHVMELSGSPLASLPNETNGSLDYLYELGLEYTQLQTVPKYLQQWYLDRADQVAHSMYGSPYCSIEIGDDDPEQKEYQRQVCASDSGQVAYPFPIDQIAPQRLP